MAAGYVPLIASLCSALAAACSPVAPVATVAYPSAPTRTPIVLEPSQGLFIPSSALDTATPGPHVARSRLVTINLGLLLDGSGRARKLAPGTEISINLFPDVNYTGVIEKVGREGGGRAWDGHLKGVEYSSLLMLYTAGIFIANISSPAGVYEVSTAGSDLYRVIEIDQSQFEGGGTDVVIPTINP